MGPSGCGKSTLLNLIAGLDTPTDGEIVARRACRSRAWTRTSCARMRRAHIGFVFQFFNLLEGMSALENVVLAGVIAGAPRKPAEASARDLLDLLGLADKARRRPRRAVGRPAPAARDRPRARERADAAARRRADRRARLRGRRGGARALPPPPRGRPDDPARHPRPARWPRRPTGSCRCATGASRRGTRAARLSGGELTWRPSGSVCAPSCARAGARGWRWPCWPASREGWSSPSPRAPGARTAPSPAGGRPPRRRTSGSGRAAYSAGRGLRARSSGCRRSRGVRARWTSRSGRRTAAGRPVTVNETEFNVPVGRRDGSRRPAEAPRGQGTGPGRADEIFVGLRGRRALRPAGGEHASGAFRDAARAGEDRRDRRARPARRPRDGRHRAAADACASSAFAPSSSPRTRSC